MNHDYISSSSTGHPASMKPDDAPSLEAPLTGFTDCHAGILRRLDAFNDLPALIATAEHARAVANDTVALFEHAVIEHHGDEERELFPAVLRWATEGEEHDRVMAMVQRLTLEHRAIEKLWRRQRSDVEAAARGKASNLQKESAEQLVQAYRQHAVFEEEEFLPLAKDILQRDSAHLAALGLSLHMRHAPVIPGYI